MRLALLFATAVSLSAQVTTTTVTRTVNSPGGVPASGRVTATITAPCQPPGSAPYVGLTPVTASFTTSDPVLSINLVPNDTCLPANSIIANTRYNVVWNINGSVVQQQWYVPTSSTPVSVNSVIVASTVITPGTLVNPAQINPYGSTAGQSICSTGPTTAPVWGNCGGGGGLPTDAMTWNSTGMTWNGVVMTWH